MKLTEFDYKLPKELIAQYPSDKRDDSRMLVLNKDSETFEHKNVRDITDYLNKGDCLVLNDTKVMPARLVGKSQTGGKAEIFILEKLNNIAYKVLLKPSARLRGKQIYFEDGSQAKVIEAENPSSIVEFNRPINLERIGRVPLPPYIKREPVKQDKARYQTVYAKNEGATAAPTAGLHFTAASLDRIRQKGINIVYVTLHVSYGTFAPVLEENIEDHMMHKEYFELPQDAVEKIRRAKANNNRVVAVGTTTTRVLESNRDELLNLDYELSAISGWTDLFIYPGYKFSIVDSLLTNFHVPKSTLLMLVSAFAKKEFMLRAYEEAVKEHYRFFSYGDCMLIM